MPNISDLVNANTTAVADAGGAYTFISEVVSTDASTIDFSNVFTSTYDLYRITATNVGSNNTNVTYSGALEFGASGYSAYQYYLRLTPNSTSTFTYGGGGVFTLNQNNTGSAGQRANFVVDIYNPLSTNAKTAQFYGVGYAGFSGIPVNQIFTALLHSNTADQTGIRFSSSAGTMTGTFRLYGFSKT
tara:strand:+ start:384 stop:944 length:561 start_codon:yes stop_codon:yes gene_type:complete